MKSDSRPPSPYWGDQEVYKCVIVVLCCLILYGCASTETKRIIDNDRVSSIKPGKTTKTEVEAILGKPYWVMTYEAEEEEWNYYMTREKVSSLLTGVPMVLGAGSPIIGIIAAAAEQARSSVDEFHSLSIRFSKEGVVKQVGKCETTAGGHKTTCESS